jgi:hypothetical protein
VLINFDVNHMNKIGKKRLNHPMKEFQAFQLEGLIEGNNK